MTDDLGGPKEYKEVESLGRSVDGLGGAAVGPLGNSGVPRNI